MSKIRYINIGILPIFKGDWVRYLSIPCSVIVAMLGSFSGVGQSKILLDSLYNIDPNNARKKRAA